MFANTTARKSESAATHPPVEAKPGAPDENAKKLVESRFGTIEIAQENLLHLPNGLLGFAEFHEFGLAPLPEGRHSQFRVLQCMTAQDLAFLVAPLNLESRAIDEDDLMEACATLGISRHELIVLLIVTVRRDDDGARVSVNMRAPLFVDGARNVARQYVLPNNKYSIRHTL